MKKTKLPDNVRDDIEQVIRNRFGHKARKVEMRVGIDEHGEESLFVDVYFKKNEATREDYRKFLGIGGQVMKVMGEDLEHLYPYVRNAELEDAADA